MKKNKIYYAGIDGGGTVTKLAVADCKGKVVFRCKGEGINYYGIGYEAAKRNMQQLFACAADNGYADFDAVTVGLSALNEAVYGKAAETLAAFIPAKKVIIDSDIGIILHSLNKNAVAVVISGTGSICSMLASNGKTYNVGGYGHIIGDEGSSYYIGECGLRAAVCAAEGWGEATTLLDSLYAYFSTTDKNTIIDYVYNEVEDKTKIANFAIKVEECAAKGDMIATKILKDNGKMLFAQFDALVKKAGENPDLVLLSGSVLNNSPVVRKVFLDNLAEKYPKVQIDLTELSPEERALKIATKGIL